MTTTMTIREALGQLRSSTGLFVMSNLANRFRTTRDDPELERLVIVHKDALRHKVSLAELDQERARGWVRFHPETFCHRCGYRFEGWVVDSDFWNIVMKQHADMPNKAYAGIICIPCFQDLFELNPPSDWILGFNQHRDEHGVIHLEPAYL